MLDELTGSVFCVPYETCVLDNGLTLIVHENHSVPQVSSNIWYRVGAKDEPKGQTGYAHLFEHLMFGGSRNLPGSFLNHLIEAGASDLNGTTNQDRTNYYATVSKAALDFLLFAESDRMGCFIDTVSQSTLDTQRGVVLNEKHQAEGAPYGGIYERQLCATYPQGHPYAHTVLGEEADLMRAQLDDVYAWFRRYYTPSNAVITLAGAIDMATARTKVQHFFGGIPPGPPLSRPASQVAAINPGTREVLEDRVQHGCVRMVWNIPPYGDPQTTLLMLAADVLSTGVASRLWQSLVVVQQLASSVGADVSGGMLCSQFILTAIARPGVALNDLEQALESELSLLIEQGPRDEELLRLKMEYWTGFLNQHETNAAKAELLSSSHVMLGAPDGYQRILKQRAQATPERLKAALNQWLNEQRYTLWVVPFLPRAESSSILSRREVPPIDSQAWEAPTLALRSTCLPNGMQVFMNENNGLPLVNLVLRLEAGSALEAVGKEGLAHFTRCLMFEGGAGGLDGKALGAAFQRIGASVSLDGTQDCSWIRVRTVKASLGDALGLLADLVIRPSFEKSVFERIRNALSDNLAQERDVPDSLLLRLAPGLLYPPGHPYARPSFTQCSEASLQRFKYADVHDFHRRYFTPERSTLVVTGDVSELESMGHIQTHFAVWQPGNYTPSLPIPACNTWLSGVFVVDRPGMLQSTLFAGTLVPSVVSRSAAFRVFHEILGNGFGSRLNTCLREQKAWTYGVGGLLTKSCGPCLWGVKTTLDAAFTVDAIEEIRTIFRSMLDTQPITKEELHKTRNAMLLSLAGKHASLDGLSGSIEHVLQYQLPDDYWDCYARELSGLELDTVQQAAQTLLDSGELTFIVVGDLSLLRERLSGGGGIQVITDYGEGLYQAVADCAGPDGSSD